MTTRRIAATMALLGFVFAVVRLFLWVDEHQPAGAYSASVSGLLKGLLWVLPSAAALWLLRRPGTLGPVAALGLRRGLPQGLAFGALATVPLALAVLLSGSRMASRDVLLGTALLGPFAEEVLFRGFLMTQLRERARLPAGWAIGVSALAFGIAHAPQLQAHVGSFHIASPWELALVRAGVLAGQVATLAAGGLVFAWVYWRTRSLWPAVGLHASLNFWLTVSADQARTIPAWSFSLVAVAQVVSFGLAIWLSLRSRRFSIPGWVRASAPPAPR